LVRDFVIMHELSIAVSIVDSVLQVAAKEKATKILGFEIEVGTLSGIVPEALEFALESAVKDTLLEKSSRKITMVEAGGKCMNCGQEFPLTDFFSPCPFCGAFNPEIIRGEELKIKSVEIENGT